MSLSLKQSNLAKIHETMGKESVRNSSSIILVPGEYFFTEKVRLLEEVSGKDLDAFLAIRLEGMSPFPIDQLYWGYLHDRVEKSVFLYAMYIGRFTLEQREVFSGEGIAHVFPSFIAAYGQRHKESTITFLSSKASLSAICWEKKSLLPLRIETLALGDSLENGREELLQLLDSKGYIVESGYWQLDRAELLMDRSVCFQNSYHSDEESKPDQTFILSGQNSVTWNADIRPQIVTKAKEKEQKIGQILWVATLLATVGFVVLIMGEGIGFVGRAYLNGKKSIFASQEAEVKLIEGQESLAQKIEQIGHNYYMPFRMLELLNDYRPKKVYFTSVNLGNENNVSIEGVTALVDDLNKFTDDLNASGLIDRFEVVQIVSRQGRITFKMDVNFKIKETNKIEEIASA